MIIWGCGRDSAIIVTIMPPKKRTRKETALENEYNTLTEEDIRKALLDVGENPGPIDASNRYTD